MPRHLIFLFWLWTFLVLPSEVWAENPDLLLPPSDAFKVTAQALNATRIQLSWQIADGYSVYRKNIRLQSKTEGIDLCEPNYPKPLIKHDELLGDIEHYHNKFTVDVPVHNPKQAETLELSIQYQACADRGICYPPQKQNFTIDLPGKTSATDASLRNPLSELVNRFSGFNLKKQNELLPPEHAFQFSASVKNGHTLVVNWKIAPDYYLYREKISLNLTRAEKTQLGHYDIPHGTPKHDEAFGSVEIFHHTLSFEVPLIRSHTDPETITLQAKLQGCADRGVCYPPMEQRIDLELLRSDGAQSEVNTIQNQPPALSEHDAIAQSLRDNDGFTTLASFFGFGLLLAFTPCIFPMIPILSGIIVGHGHRITTTSAFLLSLSYVLSSAATYTLFGVLAALFGHNLQTTFQQPWIIGLFSAVFAALSLSMFGFYHLELPRSWQTKIHNSSEKHCDGSLLGAAIMGSLSTLIVGPCVAAPLAGALLFISRTGDAFLGGSALFFMGLGMGLPLLLIGASARHLLPKAGEWLNAVKSVFGVMMLAVSVWLLSRIVPGTLAMALWALLLMLPSVYLNALDPLPPHCSGWRKLWKGLGVVMVVYGILLLIGASLGNTNPLQPLLGANHSLNTRGSETKPKFTRIHSLAELEQQTAQAAQQHRPILLDFYADWCITCIEMENYTFTDPRVQQEFARFVLLQADVTENSANDQALLAHFQLVGPPAILFFVNREEQTRFRVIGEQNADTFLASLQRVQP